LANVVYEKFDKNLKDKFIKKAFIKISLDFLQSLSTDFIKIASLSNISNLSATSGSNYIILVILFFNSY